MLEDNASLTFLAQPPMRLRELRKDRMYADLSCPERIKRKTESSSHMRYSLRCTLYLTTGTILRLMKQVSSTQIMTPVTEK